MPGVLASADDHNVRNSRTLQRFEWVEYHRFVVHRQEVLICYFGKRMEARAEPAGENDPLHI